MKAAIYLNEGTTQVVLTPENKWERAALQMIHGGEVSNMGKFWGTFYECKGGYIRQWTPNSGMPEEESLIFKIEKQCAPVTADPA